MLHDPIANLCNWPLFEMKQSQAWFRPTMQTSPGYLLVIVLKADASRWCTIPLYCYMGDQREVYSCQLLMGFDSV